jgi:hypothetical protein
VGRWVEKLLYGLLRAIKKLNARIFLKRKVKKRQVSVSQVNGERKKNKNSKQKIF